MIPDLLYRAFLFLVSLAYVAALAWGLYVLVTL